jgi:CheY-like chemotaxis protein
MNRKYEKRIYTVLVVDDEEIIRWVLRGRLERTGMFTVIEAERGDEAIHFIRLCRPDAIVLDYNLPGMDGVEVFMRLSADETTAGIPVLFFSSDKDTLKERLRQAGVYAPCLSKDLAAEVPLHLKRLLRLPDHP